ncbi:zinc transporter ZIP1-like [Ischnura elegans]|uniref:zinc transporter ZIP1-like n=1 Tax=Ischnura elegans TaxID=197161 RepID=UPI001ED8904F|nr:zinc transporter ZIP1-like [Ischnura elegans]XP_046406784.1 zinc transporter ZIP1-like [Ischnura elegans]
MEELKAAEVVHGGSGSDATVAKIAAMVMLGVVPLLLGILPWFALYLCGRRTRGLGPGSWGFESPAGRLVTSVLLCFGGGVLLCTTFFHIQPEVREAVEVLQDQGHLPTGIHLPEIFLFCGFFFVYLVEELAHAWMHSGAGGATEDAMHRTVGARRCSAVSQRTDIVCCAEEKDVFRSDLVLAPPPSVTPCASEHHGHVHVVLDRKGSGGDLKSSLAGLLAVLALSFHAVFEGLAVGLESERSSVWMLCGAIAAHKFVIAFCVGVELAAARTKPVLLILYASTFALVTPLGIGIGTAVSQSSAEAAETSVTVVALQGMAAGTLIYVVFFEVLQRGKGGDHEEDEEQQLLGRFSGLSHLLAVLAGFLAMYGLLAIGEPLENA